MDSNLDDQIQEELDKFRAMGVNDPAMSISCSTFFESIKILAIKNLLIEKGLISQDEIDLEFKKEMLRNLREAREGLTQVRMTQITKGLLN